MTMFTKDFWYHFFVCFCIAAIVGGILANTTPDVPLPAILGAFFTAMGAGLGKEFGDSQSVDNKWSWKDILADLIGAAIGAQTGWGALLINATV